MNHKLDDIDTPIDVLEDNTAPPSGSRGFLPIETNAFDRCFISVVIWIALSLFWFRFMEPAGLSIWISNVIAMAIAAIVIAKG
ncbi:DUF2160 family membrane protein [Breoghania sp. JC706]|uniref:DUF2160 family membrane protein n=1 Tax=Breoghania sp. JC706 TaxID=3117732 RepID=UPI00300AC6C2